MHKIITLAMICALALPFILLPDASAEETVIAEGEKFRTLDKYGWKITPQDESWASHTYGGMWSSHGGLLGAPADSVNSVAVQAVTIPADGKYRVWSRYQAPPYFNFMHRVEVRQGGKLLYSEVYGKKETKRHWSFGVESTQLWWPWGVDHDAAEAPPDKTVTLKAGEAELRLITVKMPEPAGDPMIDLIALTTDLTPTAMGPPGTLFTTHAMAASKLFMRFKNTTDRPARLTLSRLQGHYQPLNYAGASTTIPAADVPAGAWSEWTNIAPFCMLVHDDGLGVSLANARGYTVQVARDADGEDLVGHMQIQDAGTVAIPIDITWNPDAKVITAREHTDKLVQLATTWRTANGGDKPKELLYFGAADPAKLRDALGFNTSLPDQYQHNPIDGFFAHAITKEQIQALADQLGDQKKNLRVLSFADESTIAYADAAALTRFARKLFGPQVETGINYTPHFPMPQYYGEQATWVDIFKKGPDAMTMFWSEDFIFSVPQLPQTISWTYAVAQCAVKYNQQKIQMYILPHAPGQVPEFLRRNMVLSIGAGARYINMFCVAPAQVFSENYVSWRYPDTFRVIHESIYDSAEAEPYQINGTLRPGRVAIVRSHATEANESKLVVNPKTEPFMKQCANAAGETVYNRQILCRTDQQLLYTSLRHAQYMVDIITEDDIVDGYLKDYDVVYFAGEWIDSHAVTRLADWVQAGGILYATAGAGHLDENGNRSAAMLALLGLQDIATKKDVHILRTFLEMPLVQPIDRITLDGEQETIDAIAMRQVLTPDAAKVIGKWADGSPAVTEHSHGKGKAITVGTLAGTSYIKSGLRRVPFARGGNKELYNPTDFSPAATKLAWLGVAQADIQRHAQCSNGLVEALVMDSDRGTLVTLVNWDNEKQPELTVNVRLANQPKSIRTVQGQKTIRGWSYKDGVLSFTTSLGWADYILIDQN
jgi:hypothetical protein